VGLAWSEDECDVNNTPFEQHGRIGAEAIQALKAVWGPNPVECHGRSYNIQPSVNALDRTGRLENGFTGCRAPVDAVISTMNAVDDAARAQRRPAQRK